MDRYSILQPSATGPVAAMPAMEPAATAHSAQESVRFPGEDGGKALAETARGDLDAALQLLVERARYITGAMAATISLYEDGELICHACTGAPKQKTGTHLQVGSGLASESVRTRRILRCNDTSEDVRTNAENCRKYGISSAMVMPLVRGPEVIGVFELLSGSAQAFEERDLSALARLGEMVETAMEQSEAAKHEPQTTFFEDDAPPTEVGIVPLRLDPGLIDEPAPARPSAKNAAAADSPLMERGSIANCQACGFPVSGHRRWCVECAATRPKEVAEAAEQSAAPAFLTHPGEAKPSRPAKSGSSVYTVGTLVVVLITGAVVVWIEFPQVPAWVSHVLKLR